MPSPHLSNQGSQIWRKQSWCWVLTLPPPRAPLPRRLCLQHGSGQRSCRRRVHASHRTCGCQPPIHDVPWESRGALVRARGFGVGVGLARENRQVLASVSPSSLMLLQLLCGPERRGGRVWEPDLTSGSSGDGWAGHPDPPRIPLLPFYPATSLTTRLASACPGTTRACGTGNLGAGEGHWGLTSLP